MRELALTIFENTGLRTLPLQLEKGQFPALVSGLSSVHRAHLAAGFRYSTERPLCVICPEETSAVTMAADLETFTGERAAVITEREYIFYDAGAVSRQQEQRRLARLKSIINNEASIFVFTAQGLLQRVPDPEKIKRFSRTVRVGEAIESEKLKEFLLKTGYAFCEKVEGRGQFAVRGGIFDIWPSSSEEPVRMELWGDDVDGMFHFDVSSQRRTEEISSFHILPAAETLVSYAENGAQGLGARLREQLRRINPHATRFNAENLRNTLIADIEKIETGAEFSAADRYMDLIYPQFTSVMDYFPADALVVIDSPKKCEERITDYLKRENENILSLTEKGILSARHARFFLTAEEFKKKLEAFPVLMCEAFETGRAMLPPKTLAGVAAKQLPSYGGNAETAVQDVTHWIKQNYRCVLLAADERRASALKDILENSGVAEVKLALSTDLLPEPGRCQISVGTLSAGVEYPHSRLVIISDTQILRKKNTARRKKYASTRGKAIGSYEDLSVGDLVVHENYGIGRFAGIFRMPVDGAEKDYIKINYAGTDSLYVPATQLDAVSKYTGASEEAAAGIKLSRLGGTDWSKTRTRAKASAKKMAAELIRLYAERQKVNGHAFAEDTVWQTEFENAFEYEETEDQLRCVREIKADMESTVPMDRLLCGDVGYGKTEVALRAVMKCVMDGYQAAILVPTTVLARQHYQTVISRFLGYPVTIRQLSRYTTGAQGKKVLQEMETGSCDIVIGTHRLLQKDIKFKKLGLLVVDEEQRFGVSHKEHIKELASRVDVLTLSATPIPRTLNMALSGIRDMSTLEEPPQDRLPVQTFVIEHDWGIICDAIRKEVSRGGQVYYLHNRVDNIERTANEIIKRMPELSVDVAHGRMDEKEMSAAMEKVIDGQTQLLVCTTIIETGIDIPNVNTLIVEDADRLGLAQLHQLRGRVGRSARRACAYFTYRKDKVLSEIAEKRLEAIRQFAEFNSGFRIAMRDLEIRGAGNVLGAEQSGHMLDVGYDMYLKLLEEAVREEKGEPLPARAECSADLTITANIPEDYIRSPQQRMDFYRRIALIRTEEDADELLEELGDRFGEPGPSVRALTEVALLRAEAGKAGISDITQKGGVIRLAFREFDFSAVSRVYSRAEWAGKVKIQAGETPAVLLKPASRRHLLEEIRAFVQACGGERTEPDAPEKSEAEGEK